MDSGEQCDWGGNVGECDCHEASCYVCTPECQFVEIFPGSTYYVEEVSVLEDAYNGDFITHDAVVFPFDTCALPESAIWKVATVEVFLMIPYSQFDTYPDDVPLAIEIFDGNRPGILTPYVLTQYVDKNALDWSLITLENPTYAEETQQYSAWWTFDFMEIMPESGLNNTVITVGIWWIDPDLPAVGYSNFNLPCEDNWTIFEEGTPWQNNGGVAEYCRWPLFRILMNGENL